MPPSEIEEFSVTDIDLLSRYWNQEPWGSYRDNLHAAMIAREVRRTAFKGQHKLEDFMVQQPKKDSGETGWNKDTVFGMFKALAGGIRKKANSK